MDDQNSDEVKIRRNIKDILRNENIKFVIYVDDNLREQGSYISSLIAQSLPDLRQNEGLKALLPINFDIPDDDILISEIEKAYNEASVDVKVGIDKIIFPQSDSDKSVQDELLAIFEKDIFIAVEPKDSEVEIEKCYSSLKDHDKILVLLDQDFRHGGEDLKFKTGLELLQRLIKKDERRLMIFGMITHLIKDISKEWEWRNNQVKLLGQDGINSSTFFALTKKRGSDGLLLADGLRKVLLNPYFEDIKRLSHEVLLDSAKSMVEEIEKIDTYTFDDIVIRSSAIEGVWEAETYFRIANIILDYKVKELMKNDTYLQVINPLFEKAYKLGSKKIAGDYAKEYSFFHKSDLRSKEIYLTKEIVNELHEPVANGDIFEVCIKDGQTLKAEKYILLDQDCDLMLRTNGKRQSKIGTLIKIREINNSDLSNEIKVFAEKNKHKNHYLGLRGILEYFSNDEKFGLVEFKHSLLVYMDCLDLVSINKSGEAKFDINETYSTNCFRRSLKNRFDRLTVLWKEKHNEYSELETQFKILKEDIASSIMDKFLMNLSPTEKNAGSLKPYTQGKFDFGVKRIKRYKNPFAEILLNRYSNFLSRIAEKHDFAELN